MTGTRAYRLFVLALPIAGVLLLIGKAELEILGRPTFRVPIRGADPRDLLMGHYLRYRLETAAAPYFKCESGGCCYCLRAGSSVPEHMSCDEAATCAASMPDDKAASLDRYYIQEDVGPPLEQAVREGRAELELTVAADGTPSVVDLLIDGAPYRRWLQHR